MRPSRRHLLLRSVRASRTRSPLRAFELSAVGLALVVAGCSGHQNRPAARGTTTTTRTTASSAAPGTAASASPSSTSAREAALHIVAAPWSLPAPLDRAAAAVVDGRIYVLGGNRDGGTTAIADMIDPTTGNATRAALLPHPVHDAAGGVIAGRPAVFGGGSGVAVDAVQLISAPGSASIIGRLPQPRADVSSAMAGTTVYLAGGYDGSVLTPDVLATNDGINMRVVARLAVPVRYPAVAAVDGALYVIGGATSGGEDAGVDTNAVQRVDLRTGDTTVIARLPFTLSHASAASLAGTVYVVGGHVDGHWTDQVARFSPATGALRVVGHLARPVSDVAIAVVAQTAYVLGGEAAPNTPVASVTELRVQ
jgi:N-acetylneuraminic acid mutarotase